MKEFLTMRKHNLSKLTHNILHCISSMFSFYLIEHVVSVLSNEFHHVCCLGAQLTRHKRSLRRGLWTLTVPGFLDDVVTQRLVRCWLESGQGQGGGQHIAVMEWLMLAGRPHGPHLPPGQGLVTRAVMTGGSGHWPVTTHQTSPSPRWSQPHGDNYLAPS